MNRKLHNSLSALTASGAAMAIALTVAVPTDLALPPARTAQGPAAMAFEEAAVDRTVQDASRMDSLAQAVVLSAGIAANSAMALDAPHDADAPTLTRAPHQGSRHRRQTVVMPYFSFLPRG